MSHANCHAQPQAILASRLSGATLITGPMHTKKPEGMDISHFFVATDPAVFRHSGDSRANGATFMGALRATAPVDPAHPVMIANDPRRTYARTRMTNGIPVGAGLPDQVRRIARAAAVPRLLD